MGGSPHFGSASSLTISSVSNMKSDKTAAFMAAQFYHFPDAPRGVPRQPVIVEDDDDWLAEYEPDEYELFEPQEINTNE